MAVVRGCGIATAGDGGLSSTGIEGTAIAGDYGVAVADFDGVAAAGKDGVIVIAHLRLGQVTARVDGVTIKPNVPYRLDDDGNFVEA